MHRLLFVMVFATGVLTAAEKVSLYNHTHSKLVNKWYAEGTAAGNVGDWYDNRDRDHSSIKLERYPQLRRVSYDAASLKSRRDWGAQRQLLPNVVIGNSSTSGSVKKGGSNVRSAYYSSAEGMRFLHAQYRYNNLYVYPEHRDHDPGHNGNPGYGDLFPTNSPYVVISQGSSGSDRAFLNAFVHTLAAFHPDVKEILVRTGLLMPTLQQIFRSSNKGIDQEADYLTGKAHPTVFEGDKLDPERMVRLAHELTPPGIPPLVELKVLEEDLSQDPRYFTTERSETLCDTPGVIARIVRRAAYRKEMLVSAADSRDLLQRPLRFFWVVLRGDADRISIQTSADGKQAKISVPYHERRPIGPGLSMSSNRVDIGVFAHNGLSYSAPAFITFYTLDSENRTYNEDGQLTEIDFQASNYDYEVFNWEAFSTMLHDADQTLPARLIRDQFTEQERVDLRDVKVAKGSERVRQAFDTILKDLTLYARYRDEIDAMLVRSAGSRARSLFKREQKRLGSTGSLDERFMLTLLTEVLYPTVLNSKVVANFVDERLRETRKAGRLSFQVSNSE